MSATMNFVKFVVALTFLIMSKKKPTPRKPRTRGAGTYTEAAFWAMIRFTLREKSRYWKPIALCRKNHRRKVQTVGKRWKYEYQCNNCHNWFDIKDIEVDHIVPVGSLNCADDLPGFVTRLFAEVESLQILCSQCHLLKTQQEKK